MGSADHLRPVIVRLLSNLGSAKEIQQYLRRFSQLDAERFAVVKVGGAILRDDLEDLASALSFLQQVGLSPIVLHGAGPQLSDELARRKIAAPIVDGLRVTSPAALAVVREVFHAENLKLVEALHGIGARASSVVGGVFEADYLSRRKYGLVGRVSSVQLASIHSSLKAGSIPVIASLGETSGGQILNINADVAAKHLIDVLKPYKIVFLTGTGGLLDENGELISSINLSTDLERLRAAPWLHSGMRLKIEQIADLLKGLPGSSSVSMTRPAELAKELFTHRGSGTLILKGEAIRRYSRWSQIDTDRLRSLIESGFGRKLDPAYFEKTRLHRAYISANYRAALIITMENGIPHLDKFAVAEDAQGEGLGRAAWLRMKADMPQLFWRSRPGNSVNSFYADECDGCVKEERWNIFWYGLKSFEQIQRCVEHCRKRPATLKG